jgi:hypothetical protein
MRLFQIRNSITTLTKKFNHEFLPIVERESLLLGNLNYCSLDTRKFYNENNKPVCSVV